MRYGKYGNRKTVVDGMVFDSRHEAVRYQELKRLEKAGEITDLQMQVPFELIPAQYEEVNGKKKCLERAVRYIADFVYYDNETGQWVTEDVKGYRTDTYKIKKKLMLQVHGIRIKEI